MTEADQADPSASDAGSGGASSTASTAPTAAPASPMEVELKYRLRDPGAGEALLAADELAGLLATGAAWTVDNEDRYVDTPDGALAAAGYAGRLRVKGGETVITLKGLRRQDTGGATHRREELEGPADLAAAPADWPASDARDAVVAIAGGTALQELVRVRQVRRKRDYAADGTTVEVSVDDVEVLVGDRVVERFAELEVELREGDEARLQPLADTLDGMEALSPDETSKLERALEAVRRDAARDVSDGTDGTARVEPAATDASAAAATASATEVVAAPAPPAPRLVIPKSPGVLADDHLAEAGRKVLRFHLARMVNREPGTREGREPEELHGMRVATRRQRAAWRVFGEAFDGDRTVRYTRRLREVARDLGAVRDLDVLIEAGEAYAAQQSEAEAAAFEPLLRGWRMQRDANRLVLIRELDSAKYRKWVDAYIDFTGAEGMGVKPVGPVQAHRVRDTMPSRIWAAYETVRAYEPVMRWADVTTLHDLRIAAKWLRYTIEFVREALGPESTPVIEKVVALQDHLGYLHDADVAGSLARQFLVEHAGTLSEAESQAIGRYLVDRERELARLRRTIGPEWRGVSSLAFRRALGRLVAGI